MATTGVCDSFKVEVMQAAHCMNATVATSGTNSSGSASITALATTAGICVGMAVTGTNVAAGAVVASVDSGTAVTMSKVSTGAVSTCTFAGDVFKLALVKTSPSRTFDHGSTSIGTPGSGTPSATNLGTDEIAASGSYSSGGVTLTNVSPVLSSTTACATWSNISITSATISTTAAIIYNSSGRLGSTTGRTVEVLDFGGTQTVTSGTLSLSFPAQTAGNAVLQIS